MGGVVVAGSNTALADTLGDSLLQFMQNYGIKGLGRITAAGANPCLGCRDSLNDCEYSAVVAQYGLLERIGTVLYNPIETQLHALKDARRSGATDRAQGGSSDSPRVSCRSRLNSRNQENKTE